MTNVAPISAFRFTSRKGQEKLIMSKFCTIDDTNDRTVDLICSM